MIKQKDHYESQWIVKDQKGKVLAIEPRVKK